MSVGNQNTESKNANGGGLLYFACEKEVHLGRVGGSRGMPGTDLWFPKKCLLKSSLLR